MSGLFADFFKRLFTPPAKAVQTTPSLSEAKLPQPKEMTPKRAELINKAMQVYRQKQAVLSDLSAEQRQMLLTVALKAFFNQMPPETRPGKDPAKPQDKRS